MGLEIDVQGAAIEDKFNTTLDGGDIGLVSVGAKSSLDWFGTLRGRIGYSVDRVLLYATGGFAVGGVKDSLWASAPGTEAFPLETSLRLSRDETRVGYTVGGGVEVALTPAWSLKAEYQYIDLGSRNLQGTIAGLAVDELGAISYGANIFTNKFDHAYNTFRVGLNYRLHQEYEPLK